MEAMQSSDTRTYTPLKFLEFPREIRDKIYQECLVLKKVYPYATQEQIAWPESSQDQLPQAIAHRSAPSSNSESRPDNASNAGLNVGLLLANMAIYNEASEVLFSKNIFVMPTWHFMSKFFDLYAGKDQLNWIKSVELAFSPLDPFAAPGQLAIDRRLSPQEKMILQVDFPQQRRARIPRRLATFLDQEVSFSIGREDLLTAWLRRAMLVKSLQSCNCITLRLNNAGYAFDRLCENAIWPFVMPPSPTMRLTGWTTTLPTGMRVEGLPANLPLEALLMNIQGYRI